MYNISSATSALVAAAARAGFNKGLAAAKNPIHEVIATRVDSDSEIETYAWLGNVPQLAPWRGVRSVAALPEQSYTIRNKKFSANIGFDLDTVRREKLGQISQRTQDVGTRARAFPIRLVVEALVTGASKNCYDGQYFFDTDHVDPGAKNQTAQSNIVTQTAAAGTNPTAAEMELAVDSALSKLRSFVDDQGEPWGFDEDLHFLVPPAFQKAANLVLGDGNGLTAADVSGASGAFRGAGAIHVLPAIPAAQTRLGLTTDNKMWVVNTAGAVKPFIYQVEKDITPVILDASSEFAKLTNKVLFGVDTNMGAGYGLWQYAVEIQFT